jgi:hypothetical protein
MLAALTASAHAENFYATQSGAGSANGLSLENAWSVVNLNSTGNWSSTETVGKVDPGDTVYLIGPITSQIVIAGSGAAGEPVVIDGANSTISVSVIDSTRVIRVLSKQYLTFKNLTVDGLDTAFASGGSCSAIDIREFGTPTGHIDIVDSRFRQACSGVLLQGSVTHVNIKRNIFEDMANSGVAMAADNYDSDGLDDYDDVPTYIVVGGSSSDGNTFRNVGHLNTLDGSGEGAYPGTAFGTWVKDAVFSYNHVYADKTAKGSGVYVNGGKRVLVEFNTIHGVQAERHRPPINFKQDTTMFTEDVIIRFNHVYDIYHGDLSYIDEAICIRVSGEGDDVVVYGNYCKGGGIDINWNWVADNDDVGGSGRFVWSNIINETWNSGGVTVTGSSLNTDVFSGFYILNNTVYRAVSENGNDTYFTGLHDNSYSPSIIDTIVVKNNLVADTRPWSTDHDGISFSPQSDLALSNNLDQSSALMGWGNPAGGDFSLTLSSPAISGGANLSQHNSALPTITVMGVQHTFSFSNLLAPGTDWSTVPPTIVTETQSAGSSAWSAGAYYRVPFGVAVSFARGCVISWPRQTGIDGYQYELNGAKKKVSSATTEVPCNRAGAVPGSNSVRVRSYFRDAYSTWSDTEDFHYD